MCRLIEITTRNRDLGDSRKLLVLALSGEADLSYVMEGHKGSGVPSTKEDSRGRVGVMTSQCQLPHRCSKVEGSGTESHQIAEFS